MSAVQQRSRRATAGKRMSSLVGKAAEEDETFWGHSTWAEEPKPPTAASDSDEVFDSSDEGSYRLSDEEEENKVDVFDSDFDDSESEEEAGED
eukprot:10117740-Ditylum_brightwellii.AAC.1